MALNVGMARPHRLAAPVEEDPGDPEIVAEARAVSPNDIRRHPPTTSATGSAPTGPGKRRRIDRAVLAAPAWRPGSSSGSQPISTCRSGTAWWTRLAPRPRRGRGRPRPVRRSPDRGEPRVKASTLFRPTLDAALPLPDAQTGKYIRAAGRAAVAWPCSPPTSSRRTPSPTARPSPSRISATRITAQATAVGSSTIPYLRTPTEPACDPTIADRQPLRLERAMPTWRSSSPMTSG